jgi:hypothetical protein
MAQTLQRDMIYPTADMPTPADRKALGLTETSPGGFSPAGAKWTGEKRPPKAGEWYLSGARIAAYRAPNDLSTAYCIAQLVPYKQVTKTVTTWEPIA